MKTILYLYPTWDRAKQAFKEFIEHNDPNDIDFTYRYANLTAVANGVQRRFVSCERLEENLRGYSFDSVFVDIDVNLDEDQKAMMRSRVRNL